MSWYVLHCRPGQEQKMICSCRRHLSHSVLEDAFVFQCKRLWKTEGTWRLTEKDMFPGYVFLQSSRPKALSEALAQYRAIFRIMEDKGYLISVYKEEEEILRQLCDEKHQLSMSYGYKDRDKNISYITQGPLLKLQNHIIRLDWHRRFAQVEVTVARKKAVVWAGLDIASDATSL